MKINFTKIKLIVCLLFGGFTSLKSNAQTLSTTGSFLNNNGSGGVTFNLQNSNSYPIIISEIKGVIGVTGTSPVSLYYNTTPVSGAPAAITTANGWNLVASGSVSATGNTTTTTTQSLLSGLSFIIPANTTYGILVYALNQRYFTMPATGTTTISASGVNLTTGANIGYGGTGIPPIAPTINSRGWIGDIIFNPAIACSGTPTTGNSVSNVGYACSGQPILLSLANDSIRTGLSYQWLRSTSSLAGPYSIITNDTTRSTIDTQTVTTWYRCRVGCGTNYDTSTAVKVTTSTTPLTGTYTVNAALPSIATNYNSLAELATELACVGVSGPLQIDIDSLNSNQSVAFGIIPGVSEVNTITINGKNKTLSSSTASPIMSFEGTKYVTVDSLQIVGTGTFAGFVVKIGSQAQYITIKNSTINAGTTSTATSNAGIVISGSQTSATTAGNNAQYITINNNNIIGGYYGITALGETGYLNNFGHTISNNRVSDFYFYGIYLANADSSIVNNNDINRATRGTLSTFYGVFLTTSRNIKVRNNKIRDAGIGTYTAYPIYLANCVSSTGFENEFINNNIYNINTTGTFYGIYSLTTALTGAKFFHNTIAHHITSSTGAIRGAFFSVATTSVDFRNNIISLSGSGTGIKTNIYFTTASLGFTSNNNVLFNNAIGGTNLIGYWAANQITLANWRTASSQDLNSVSLDPSFLNLSTGNLVPNNPLVDNIGSPTGVLTDILGNSRSTITPDAGAFEFNLSLCSGTPIPGNAVSSIDSACNGTNFTLGLANDVISVGLTYQWLRSNTGLAGSYTVILNDTNRITSESQTATTWYRCRVFCVNSSIADTSTAVRVVRKRAPFSGNFTVNASIPISATNYHSLALLSSDLTCGGITSPININIDSVNGNQTIAFGNISGASAVNTITINGKNKTISSINSPIVSFSGTKYVIIDSLNIEGGTGFAGFGVLINNQSQYITLKNSTVNVGTTSTATSNAGIVISGSQTGATIAGNNAQYITINNNNIIGGYYGITALGETGYLNNFGHVISNNRVSNFYLYGIYLANADSSIVNNNDINRATRGTVSTFYGIYMTTSRNIKVRNNKIRDAGIGTYTAYPIYLTNCVSSTGFENEFINNTIYNINTTGTFYGIYSVTTALTGAKFYHNTIAHHITSSTGTIRGAFFSVATTSVDFRNNIISLSGSGTGIKTNIYFTTASLGFTSNNNVLFNNAIGGTNLIGYWAANQITLANWRTASGLDLNSVSFNPVFTNLATGLLNPISVNVDNIGTPIGVLTDIIGNTRSTTTPDAGAFEFTGAGIDLALKEVKLLRSSICYSTSDTIKVTVENLIGSTIDFSVDPLTIIWNKTGANAQMDSIVITSDTLGAGLSKVFYATNVNMQTPGFYNASAYIRLSLTNTTATNDTVFLAAPFEVKPILSVLPKTRTVTSSLDTVLLEAFSPIFPGGGVFFSEIAHYKIATGAPIGGWPTYLTADDYVELTGVPSSSIAGYTMEEWTGTALQHSVTFPTGTLFSPNGTMILATGQLGSSTPSPTNFYYHTGNTVTHSSTGDNRGYLIKNQSGVIVDAAVYGTYTFPTTSGVTSTIWSGNTPAVSSSGNRLNAPDNNTSSSWVNSGVTPQNPNAINGGVTAPVPGTMAGFNWSFLGTPFDTNARTKVGPYTTPGVRTYVATYTNTCGTFYDTAVVTASSTVPVKMISFEGNKKDNNAFLNWATSSEINNDYFIIERSFDGSNFEKIGTVKGKVNSTVISNYSYTDQGIFNDPKNQIIYYRLNQVDLDGTSTISQVVIVTSIDDNNGLTIFPNPSNGIFNIVLETKSNSLAKIKIIDIFGKTVWNNERTLLNGINAINVNLSKGNYILLIEENDRLTTKKIIIN